MKAAAAPEGALPRRCRDEAAEPAAASGMLALFVEPDITMPALTAENTAPRAGKGESR